MTPPRWMKPTLSALAFSLLLVGNCAIASADGSLSEAQARFKKEMAVCDSGQSQQSLADCRKEARNALADAKRGDLEGSTTYRKNARERCKTLSGTDRSACESRARGEGLIEGSVRGGGILRETITVVPAQPSKAPN